MKVAFLTRYDERRASSRVRAYRYAPYLAELGITARYLPWANRPRVQWPTYVVRSLALAAWADVVVLHKPFHPPWFVEALRRCNARLVVDVDDAIWEPTGPDDAARATELGRRLGVTLRSAVAAVAGNRILADWLVDRAPGLQVTVIPSPVEPERVPVRHHQPVPRPVVGWIGSPENLRELEVCARPLASLAREERVCIRVVSSKAPRLDGCPVEFVPWSLATEAAAVATFDIGIMPLVDTPRTRGRCGFKAIEYMAAGIPVVASAVPGPADVVEDGVTGFLVDDRPGWERALQRLITDHALRATLGAAGRRRVEERYATSVTADQLAAVLREAAGRTPHRQERA